MNKTIILDNGHGIDTKGKCSPDGQLKEYAYAREIVQRVAKELKREGYDVRVLVPEPTDIPLPERVRRCNKICADKGAGNCLLVSVHCNAMGNDNKWHTARGWQVHVARNASTNAKKLAFNLFAAAQTIGLKTRRPSAKECYWVQNLMICRDTKCPAVLTENLFQDNLEDVEFLLSEDGKDAITKLHVDGIMGYCS